METSPGTDAGMQIPIEAILAAPFQKSVSTWETLEPIDRIEPERLARASGIFDLLNGWVEPELLERLQAAVQAGDGRAQAELVQLDQLITQTCNVLIKRCKRWKEVGDWSTLRHEAQLAVHLASAGGRAENRTLALYLLAVAYRARGDIGGTIRTYEDVIQSATVIGDEHMLAVAHDNIGNALADAGRLDDAVSHYKQALQFERNPEGRRSIRSNCANALVALGELHRAQLLHEDMLDELMTVGAAGPTLAVALDNTAASLLALGNPEKALDYLQRATDLFDPDDHVGLSVNALGLSDAYAALGRTADAAQYFEEAFQRVLRFAQKQIDPAHYRRGYLDARSKRLPPNSEVMTLFLHGVRDKEKQAWQQALANWQSAAKGARDAHDFALALRIDANAAGLLFEAGKVEQAIGLAQHVRHEAGNRGLALPEHMAVGTLASIAASGADIREQLGPLGMLARAMALKKQHTATLTDIEEEDSDQWVEIYDTGTIEGELALLAIRHFADDIALEYMQVAVAKARELRTDFSLVNRLAGLHSLWEKREDRTKADAVAKELEQLVGEEERSVRSRLVGHRALGQHYKNRNLGKAIDHLRQACQLAETLRQRMRPGAQRSAVTRQFGSLNKQLARLLRDSGDDVAAFDALQGGKGRRLIDVLADQSVEEGSVPDLAPTTGEVMELLHRLDHGAPSVLADLAVYDDGITTFVVDENGVSSFHVDGDMRSLIAAQDGDVREREQQLVDACCHNRLLCNLAKRLMAGVPAGTRLLLVPDDFLHNFPLHIVPVDGVPWCERIPIGFLPAAGALRFAPGRRPRSGRALVAGDSRGDLPQAAAECRIVAKALGTKPLIRSDCTQAAIETALQQGDLDVVHLALHGRGDVRRGGRGSLLLADADGGTDWVSFEELSGFRWHVELVVLSGCSTGVSGPLHGHELVGAARAVAEAGAAAVVACLWPVGDAAAEIFMRAFYSDFLRRRAAGPVDLRVVMDHARNLLRSSLRDGELIPGRRRDGHTASVIDEPAASAQTHPLAWAPFVVMGDPIVGG